MNTIAPTHIRLAYHEAPTEPRIMIFGPMSVDLRLLKKCFRQLSSGEAQIEFHSLPFVVASGDVRLRMCSVGRLNNRNARIAFGLRRVEHERVSFEWTLDCEEWDDLAELLSPLPLSPEPAHQYLAGDYADDAIVVVSKGEYDDSVMTQQG